MLKILILTAFPPSNYGAGVNYTYNVIQKLKNDFTVDIFYFENKLFPSKISEAVLIKNNSFTKLLRAILFPILHPFFTCRFDIITFLKVFRDRKKYDVIYFDFSQVLIYSIFFKHARKFFMTHDVIYQKYSRKRGLFSKLNKNFIFLSENYLLKKSNCQILTFSRKDALVLKKIYKINSTVVDFFIDNKIYESNPLVKESYFCFYGAWNRKENTEMLYWFMKKVIQSTDKHIRFKIIGGGIPKTLASACIKFSNVEILGFVENPYQIISSSMGLLAPIFNGAGVKMKVLESLLCGIPVLGTEIAFEGIGGHLQKHAFQFKTSIELAGFINNASQINNYDRNMWKREINLMYPNLSFVDLIKSEC
jgi:glycosyltransferase involved in cell wall biosynthesis